MKTHEAADFLPSVGERDRRATLFLWEVLNIAVLCLVAVLVLGAAVTSLVLYEVWAAPGRRRRLPNLTR